MQLLPTRCNTWGAAKSHGTVGNRAGSAQALEDQRHALTATDAHRDEAGRLVVRLQRVEHRLKSGNTTCQLEQRMLEVVGSVLLQIFRIRL